MDSQTHRRRLQLQNFDEGEINMAVSRVELYAEYNRAHPGFFDAFISTSQFDQIFSDIMLNLFISSVRFSFCLNVIADNLDDAYEQLRELVISYLGLEDDRIEAPRPNTSDEIKRFDDFDIQRSGKLEF